jgi:hypothetical protein
MLKITLSAFAAPLLALILAPDFAQAQSRVFVAAQGSDGNPCTFAQPCRTFQHAHDTVAAGGEIDVLDPAGYGALTITKSVSIQGHGFSGITAASGIAITVTAGATAKVNLRGLVIEGFGSGHNGIVFNTGAELDIQECIVRNFTAEAIKFVPTTASNLAVSNTIMSNAGFGLFVRPAALVSVTAVLDHVQAVGNGFGLSFTSSIDVGGSGTSVRANVNDSVMENISITAITCQSSNSQQVVCMIGSTTVANNSNDGLVADGANAKLLFSRSVITGNGTGLVSIASGQLITYGDNNVAFNGDDGLAAITSTFVTR